MNKILILGYYNRNNLGDDIMYYILDKYFKKNFPNSDIIIKNTDDIEEIPKNISTIIIGGGDLINNYFIDKINLLLNKMNYYCPVYAIGIGIPYPKLIDEGYLDIFDFVIHRNILEHEKLVDRYSNRYIKLYPDLGFLLNRYIEIKSDKEVNKITYNYRLNNKITKNIGIFLNRCMYNVNDEKSYDKILIKLASFFAKIADKSKKRFYKCSRIKMPVYNLFFYSMCTNDNKKENDLLLNKELIFKINGYRKKNYDNIHFISTPIKVEEINPIFNKFHMTICTRYHAHVFSLLNNIPLLSIYSTSKVENLLNENKLLEYSYKMPVDNNTLQPLDINETTLLNKFSNIENGYDKYKSYLENLSYERNKELDNLDLTIKNIVHYRLNKINTSYYKFDNVVNDKIKKVSKYIVKFGVGENKYLEDKLIKGEIKVYEVYENLLKNGEEKEVNEMKYFLAEMIIYVVLQNRYTKYNYGLAEQIFNKDYNLFDSIKWILDEYYKENPYMNNITELDDKMFNKILLNKIPLEERKLNMNYFNHDDLRGFHRSGWQYIIDHLYMYHTNREDGIILDSFMDKTYGWYDDFYNKLEIIPINKPWIGFIHHTPNIDYSKYNVENVFKSKNIDLKSCKKVITFSEYLKNYLETNIKLIEDKIYKLHHPTNFNTNNFTYEKFINNDEKKLIQVGAWMRNSYAIFELTGLIDMKKYALKGTQMENYYLSNLDFDKLKDSLFELGCNIGEDSDVICRDKICRYDSQYCNKYVMGLYKHIEKVHNSVTILEKVSNKTYDKLLSENIVFINLVDASAVNTLIECIVRNTPILVNKLSPVVEYLGKDYNLYYKDYSDAVKLVNNKKEIKKAYEYLKKMDKSELNIEKFLMDFVSYIK